MIKFNKTVTALSVALAIGVMAVPTQAEAAPRSHYDYASNITNNQSQVNFVTKMIANYTRTAKIYGNLIDKYGAKYGHYSWFTPIIERHAFFLEEMTKYSQLLNSIQNDTVTVLNKTVRTEPYVQTKNSDPALISSVDTVEKEISDGMIYEYAVLTQVIETITTVRTYEMTVTDISYSDGTKDNSRIAKLLDTTETPNRETTRDRELIRSYAVPVVVKVESPVEVESVETGTTTVEILTVDEYLARDDVDYTGTEAYRQAAWNTNSRINANYIDRESGLAQYASSLVAIGAPQAWARGWTGKGSIIGIVDSGIDLDHSEFAGKIIDAKCFTRSCDLGYETVDDITKVSHGTHVAGIAAASLDGVGTTGVAPDAKLLIAKSTIGTYGAIDLNAIVKGVEWAALNGADAINVSSNYNVDRTYQNSVVEVEAGVYRSTDTRGRNGMSYDKDGYSFLLVDTLATDLVAAMKDTEAVVVAAAGNQRLDYSTFPAHYAVLENEDGTLAMEGRIIVAGSYDLRSQKIARYSNKAGTVCYDYDATADKCNTDHRISDYYLMAPGSYVASTDKDGEYRLNTGTSMAAPMITGAVAVIKQMWPHMKGQNLAKLLLNTGNKDIPNYDVNVHGQGVLDLAAATSPQGVIGIPTTGRVEGNKTTMANSGTTSLSGATISAFSTMMVVDDYDRDFYVDGNDLIGSIDTRTVHTTKAAQSGKTFDQYSGYANGIRLSSQGLDYSISDDGGHVSTTVNNVTFGALVENKTFLGNYADSMLMNVDGSNTLYMGYNAEYETNGVTYFGAANVGVTSLNVDSSAMMKSSSSLVSNSASLGAKFKTNSGTFGIVAALPVAIANGSANFDVAASVSDNGDIVTDNMTSSLASDAREYNMGAFYNTSLTHDIGFEMFAEARNNYTGTAGLFQMEAGVTLNGTF
jgi:hypothetical protein